MSDTSSPGFERRIRAAEGYIELGMHLDANSELEEIEPGLRTEAAVLQLRLRIYRGLEKWVLMQAVGKALALRDEDNPNWFLSWAYATRRADSIAAARLILLEAVERIPTDAPPPLQSRVLRMPARRYRSLKGEASTRPQN